MLEPQPQRQGAPKRHHYIPEMILRRFAGDDLHLWAFDKHYPERGPERKPIARLFRERELYTVVAPDGARDRSSETRLSQIEGRAGPILERIVQETRQRRLPRLSETDRYALALLIIAQLKRTPDHFEEAIARQDVEAEIEASVAEWERLGGTLTDRERADYESGRLAHRVKRNLLASSAPDLLQQSFGALMQRGFSVGWVMSPSRSLLLGSNPVIRFRGHITQRNGLVDPTAELWLPLAPDVALCSVNSPERELVIAIDEAGIQKFNLMTASQSSILASSSREMISAFARRLSRERRRKGTI